MKFLNKFSLEASDNPNAIHNISSNRYMPTRSLVLPGSEIFTIFFNGTEYEDQDEHGKPMRRSLKTQWGSLKECFDNALIDISEMSFDNAKTFLEYWFDVLKKVMHMWNDDSELAAINKSKQVEQEAGAEERKTSDADDFYVFLYDEEDKSMP